MALLHSIILGQGEPLIILHGYFGMADNWKTLGKRLSESYEVHLLDQRNHGRSFHTEDFSYDLMVEDLQQYLRHYQLESVNIIGHSMGGKVAMLFATRYPELVKKLVIVDIGPKYYAPHHHEILKALNAIDFSEISSRNEIDELYKAHISEIGVRQFLLKNVYRKDKDKFGYRFNLKSLTENNPKIGEALPTQAVYKGATLFLKGSKSNYITEEDEMQIYQHFTQAKIKTIENAGHWLHAENPQQFYTEVLHFLNND